jgi:hypothetical protein
MAGAVSTSPNGERAEAGLAPGSGSKVVEGIGCVRPSRPLSWSWNRSSLGAGSTSSITLSSRGNWKRLERRLRAGGRVIVDHPHGGHDDYATAVALQRSRVAKAGTSTLTAGEILAVGDDEESDDGEESFYRRAYRPKVLF